MRKAYLLFFISFIISINVLVSSADMVIVHQDFDWEGDGANGGVTTNPDESCVACHKDLMEMTVSYDLINICEDCHLQGGRGPFERDAMQIRDDIDDQTPFIYSHYNGSANISLPDQSGIFGGSGMSSCFGFNPQTGEGTCHGVTFGFNGSAGGYFTFNENYTGKLKDSHPYMWDTPVENMPDTSNCRFCHLQDNMTIRKVWGNASEIDPETCTDTSNEGCWTCHGAGVEPESFHSIDVFKTKTADTSDLGSFLVYGLVSVFVLVSVALFILVRKKR